MNDIQQIRYDHELPVCIEKWDWKYHHLGIPTDKTMTNEKYLPQLKFIYQVSVQALMELNG